MCDDRQLSAAEHWKRSSRCSSGQCVEVALMPGMVYVRDSKDRQKVISVELSDWASFVACVRGLPGGEQCSVVGRTHGRQVLLGYRHDQAELSFTRHEWEAFVEGIRAGEFEL